MNLTKVADNLLDKSQSFVEHIYHTLQDSSSSGCSGSQFCFSPISLREVCVGDWKVEVEEETKIDDAEV